MLQHTPNVLLLTIDTLRADRLGCYGATRTHTPNLDRLAERGVVFTQAITGGSWTQAAFPVLMTSSYASMYGGCLGALAPERPAPIAKLSEHGYTTAGFSTSPLLSRSYGYDRGFQHFCDLLPNETDPILRTFKGGQRLLRNPLTHQVAGLLQQKMRPAKLYTSAADVTDVIGPWLARVNAPFFGWVHYMDVHWPYHLEDTLNEPAEIAGAWQDLAHLHGANWHGKPITPQQRTHYIELYEQAVAYTDAQIGRLLHALEQNGLQENTIIIVVADHGEEFMEHGRWGHWENNLYDEVLRVPLIIHLPTSQGTCVVERQVRTLDLMPTILELCGGLSLDGMEGRSLVPLWRGEEEQYDPPVSISEMWRDEWHIIAVRTETHKYIWDSKQPEAPKLYNLVEDPHEEHNICTDAPCVAQQLHEHVEERLRMVAATAPSTLVSGPELDGSVVERLRGLGYLD